MQPSLPATSLNPDNQDLLASLHTAIPLWAPHEVEAARARFESFLASGRLYTLFPTTSKVTEQDIRALVPEGRVFACDFYVQGFEDGHIKDSGIYKNDIFNIDHHADVPSMRQMISSGTLAIRHVKTHGIDNTAPIFINHTDADSILSSLIMAGVLPPDEALFGTAVIAADHTGEQNSIADLLQSLDNKRNYLLSVESLFALLAGDPLNTEAQAELLNRYATRKQAYDIALNETQITKLENIVLIETDQKIAGEMFTQLFQEHLAILLVETIENKAVCKMRLTTKGMECSLNLHDLKLYEILPGWGGRWNAGSNNRAGGCEPSFHIIDIAHAIDARFMDQYS
jgi:hypothetical protein